MDLRSVFGEPDNTAYYLYDGYNCLWRCYTCGTYILTEQQLKVHYVSNCSKAIKKKPGNVQNIFIEAQLQIQNIFRFLYKY